MTGSEPFPPDLQRLAGNHDVETFDSGEESLDTWLRDHALTMARRRLSATHVWSEPAGRVIAYSSLCAASVARDELPSALGHGMPQRIPAFLLARLAQRREIQGQQLSGVLLTQTLHLAAACAADVGAALVVVDALNDRASRLYTHFGFRALRGTGRLAHSR